MPFIFGSGPGAVVDAAQARPAIAAVAILDRSTVVTYPWLHTPLHIRSAVEALDELDSDWDSYGADPLDALLVERAGRVLEGIYAEADRIGVMLTDPVVAPGADGSIALVWRAASGRDDVEIVVTAASVDFASTCDGEVDEGPVNDAADVVRLLVARVLD